MARDLDTIPLSNDTVSRRIKFMTLQMTFGVNWLKEWSEVCFALLQVDESTDISNSAQLLVFIRYSFGGRLHEDMLFCSTLEGTCTGNAIFTELDSKLREMGLPWYHAVWWCVHRWGWAGQHIYERLLGFCPAEPSPTPCSDVTRWYLLIGCFLPPSPPCPSPSALLSLFLLPSAYIVSFVCCVFNVTRRVAPLRLFPFPMTNLSLSLS